MDTPKKKMPVIIEIGQLDEVTGGANKQLTTASLKSANPTNALTKSNIFSAAQSKTLLSTSAAFSEPAYRCPPTLL